MQKSGQNYAGKTNHRPRTPESPYQRKKSIRFVLQRGRGGKVRFRFFNDFPVSYQRRKTRFGGKRLLSGPVFSYGNLRSGVFFFFFQGRTRREERHKGITGRGHDLRLLLRWPTTVMAKPTTSRQKQTDLTAKPKTSQQNQKPHGKTKYREVFCFCREVFGFAVMF